MMKKVIAFVLTLCLGAFVLTGCQGDSQNQGDAQNQGDSQNQGDAQNQSEDLYQMVMQIITYGFDDPDLKEVEDAVNAITEKEIGVHVSFLTTPIADLPTKAGLLASSNEQLDLLQSGMIITPTSMAAEGLIIPIDEYLSEELLEKAGVSINACKVDGKIYGYPMSFDAGSFAALIYDKDLATEYNIEMPKVISSDEDWEGIFEQVKNSGMSQYAISLGDGQNSELNYGVVCDPLGDEKSLIYGAVMDIENGSQVENWYESDAYMEQSKRHRSWYEKGYALPDSISNGYTVGDTMMQGQVFSFCGTVSVSTNIASYAGMTGKNVDYVPILSDQAVMSKSSINTSGIWSVSSSCKDPQKVCDFLDLLYRNTELANLMTYGIEGKHYVATEGSRIIDYPEGADSRSVGYGAFIGTYGNVEDLYYRAPLTDEFVEEITMYGPKEAKVSKFMGYDFDTSSVQTEIASVKAAIDEYGPSLHCGTVDPDEVIPKFQQALKDAGIDKIISENQKQLDEWLAQQ